MRGTALTVASAYRLVCSGTQLEISVYACSMPGCSRAGWYPPSIEAGVRNRRNTHYGQAALAMS